MRERGIVEENLSVEKKKEKRSQIVPPEEEEEDKDVLERELDVFSFFLEGRFFLHKKCGKRLVVAQFENALVFALTTIGGGWSVPPPLHPGIPRRRYC